MFGLGLVRIGMLGTGLYSTDADTRRLLRSLVPRA